MLSEMIKHHVNEEEKRDGLFANRGSPRWIWGPSESSWPPARLN